MVRFFIHRPIFAWVVAIILMIAGALAIRSLPISQYPAIAPPAIAIAATYPGASAQTLQDSVTQVIEQRMTGLDRLRYLESSSDAAGNVTITLTFEPGTSPDIAQVQVQNRLALATPLLPQEVQQLGVRVTKSVRNFLLVLGVVSTDGALNEIDLGDFAVNVLQEPISRISGVGDIQTFGTQYAMRVWLNPERLNNYRLNVTDIAAALQAQNAQVPAGQLGGLPLAPGQALNATITAQTRLRSAEEFRRVLLRVNPDGSRVTLGDVARVELGAESYNIVSRYSGSPSSGMAIRPATGANALETVDAIRRRIAELEPTFPPGVKIVYPLDTTPFVRLSIEEVVKTLLEAVALVFLVMFLFLQNLRATLIPTLAVPVVLLGTFAVMAAAGFTINTLTMFGLVLAIGLLVDDAIVVVENVERVMAEEGLPPLEATEKSMGQITGALVGIGLVLTAVFVPMAFFPGSVGVIYRQFSLTIVAAMVLSVFVALTLTPALCATLLKPADKQHHGGRRGFFGWFNRVFERNADRYARGVGGMIARAGRSLLVYALIIGGLWFLFQRLPTGFLPDEDQGLMYAQAQLPPGATQPQAMEVLRRIEHHFLETEKENVEGMFGVVGFSFSGSGQNQVFSFIRLKDWEHRSRPEQRVGAIQARALKYFSGFKDAFAFAFAPPAVLELGTANGFDVRVVDNLNQGHERLFEARNQLLGLAAKDPALANVRPNALEDTPQYRIETDQVKASALGVSLADINRTLSVAWGSSYVNDFLHNGRVKRVYVQADAPYRMMPDDVNRWYVRNARGEMTPFSAFATGAWTRGPARLDRFNGIPATPVQGQAAAGRSSGEAMAALERLARELPAGFGLAWTGLSYEQRLSGSQAPALYAISLVVVFLCLAALYESWSIPLAVLLVVPLGVIGTLLAVTLRGLSNDVYFQVGLLTIVGLSAKNAILIVEFAKDAVAAGLEPAEAALRAARQRLRPILMTSLAFGLGVLPLAISRGAGSGSQNAIGTAVIGGTITATLLGVFLVPVFFVVVRRLAGRRR